MNGHGNGTSDPHSGDSSDDSADNNNAAAAPALAAVAARMAMRLGATGAGAERRLRLLCDVIPHLSPQQQHTGGGDADGDGSSAHRPLSLALDDHRGSGGGAAAAAPADVLWHLLAVGAAAGGDAGVQAQARQALLLLLRHHYRMRPLPVLAALGTAALLGDSRAHADAVSAAALRCGATFLEAAVGGGEELRAAADAAAALPVVVSVLGVPYRIVRAAAVAWLKSASSLFSSLATTSTPSTATRRKSKSSTAPPNGTCPPALAPDTPTLHARAAAAGAPLDSLTTPGADALVQLCAFLGGDACSADLSADSSCARRAFAAALSLGTDSEGGALAEAAAAALPSPDTRSALTHYLLSHAAVMGAADAAAAAALLRLLGGLPAAAKWEHVPGMLRRVTAAPGGARAGEGALARALMAVVAQPFDGGVDVGGAVELVKEVVKVVGGAADVQAAAQEVVLTPEWCSRPEIGDAHRAKLVVALLCAEHTGGASPALSTALRALALPPAAAAAILDAAVSSLGSSRPPPSSRKSAKSRRASKASAAAAEGLAPHEAEALAAELLSTCAAAATTDSDSGGGGDAARAAAVSGVCVLADFVALNASAAGAAADRGGDRAAAQAPLLRSLFGALAALALEGEDGGGDAGEHVSQQPRLDAALDYCLMAVFGALSAVLSASGAPTATAAAGTADDSNAADGSDDDVVAADRMQLVARLLQHPLSTQARSSGLLLLARMAERCTPAAVTPSLGAVLGVLAEGAARAAAPDSASFAVTLQVLGRVLPALRGAGGGGAVVARAAVGALAAPALLLGRVRPACRGPLLAALVEALGAEVLPRVCAALLAHAAAENAAENTEENAGGAVALLEGLLASAGPAEQLRTLAQLLRCVCGLAGGETDETDETDTMDVEDVGAVAAADVQRLVEGAGAEAAAVMAALLSFVQGALGRRELHVLMVGSMAAPDGGVALQRELLRLCEALLQLLRVLAARHSEGADAGERAAWAALQRSAYHVFGTMQSLLSMPSFVAVIMELLQSEDPHLQLKGLQMLNKRLETSPPSAADSESHLLMDLVPEIRSLATAPIAATTTADSTSDDKDNGGDGGDGDASAAAAAIAAVSAEQGVVSETALLALHMLAQAFADTHRQPFILALTDASRLSVAAAAALAPSPPQPPAAGKKRKSRGAAAATTTPAVSTAALSLTSSAFMCLATLVALLRARAFPQLPSYFPAMLSALEWSSSPSAAAAADADEQRSRALLLLQQSVLSSSAAVASALPQFLHAYLTRLLALALDPRLLAAAAVRPYIERLLSTLCSAGVEPRLLLPAAFRAYTPALPAPAAARLHAFVGGVATQLGRDAVVAHLEALSTYFVGAMDYRRVAAAAAAEQGSEALAAAEQGAAEVDGALANALLAVILKLNERELRPLFLQLCRWKDLPFATHTADDDAADEAQHGEEQEALRRGRLDRAITFYSVLGVLSAALKAILVPYFAHVLADATAALQGAVGGAAAAAGGDGAGIARKRKKRRKGGDDGAGEAEAEADMPEWEAARHVALRGGVVAALSHAFQFDRAGFADAARFEAVMPSLVAQIDAPLLLSRARAGAHDHAAFVDRLLAPCLAHLAFAAGSGALWKPLVNAVLMRLRSPAARARLAALAVLDQCFRVVGEDFLSLLPECLPFLSEAMEDPNQEVEAATRRLIKYIEDVLGESVESYLS